MADSRSFAFAEPTEEKLEAYLEEIRQSMVPSELFFLYLTEVRRFSLLTKAEEQTFGKLVKERDDQGARNKLVEHNLRLAIWMADFFRGGELGYLDLIQEANIGLIKAAEKFDPDRGFRFTSYATWWLRQAITRGIYRNFTGVRIPEYKRKKWNRIVNTSIELAQKLGREPFAEEIAIKLQIPMESVLQELQQMKAFRTYSHDIGISEDGGSVPIEQDASSPSPEELLEAEEEVLLRYKRIQHLLVQLSSLHSHTRWLPRERDLEIFQMRYGLDDRSFEPKLLEEIAQRFSLTRQRIDQIVRRVWSELEQTGRRGIEIHTFLSKLLETQAKGNGVPLRTKGKKARERHPSCALCGHKLSTYNLTDRCFHHVQRVIEDEGFMEGRQICRNGRIEPASLQDFSAFEKKTGISFMNKKLLWEALTHRSFANKNPSLGWNHNERLEFLGDAILESAVTKWLFRNFPGKSEGELTSLRSALVNTEMLAKVAQELGLNNCLLLSKGEDTSLGRSKPRILADTLEALIGAIFLDQGDGASHKFIEKHLISRVDEVLASISLYNPKGLLQEKTQELWKVTPTYQLLQERGPDHARRFIVGVYIGEEFIATGEGSSKKESEEQAAKVALRIKGWET